MSLPSENDVKALIGATYHEDSVLNVVNMMAGTQDMYPSAWHHEAAPCRPFRHFPLRSLLLRYLVQRDGR